MIPFENYCEGIKRFGGKVTYTKEEYELKYGAPKEFEPMIITPRNQKRPTKATFENSKKPVVKKSLTTEKSDHIVRKREKVARPKKPKAANPPKTNRVMSPKTSLKGMPERLDAGSHKSPESGKRQELQSTEETEAERSHFVNAQEWYDYHEALRILNEMRKAG